tara:strand:- start:483 stop:683 length:201 start_codon:yes stop_codon:yes gene_type:complete
MWYSIYKMNDMKNTKTDWIQMKRDRARNAEHIADIQRTNRHVFICNLIISGCIGAMIVLLAIHFSQ